MYRFLLVLCVWCVLDGQAFATSYTMIVPVNCSGSAMSGCTSKIIAALETAYTAKFYARSATDTVHGNVLLSTNPSQLTVTVLFYDQPEAPNASHAVTFAVLPSIPTQAQVLSTLQGVSLP